MVLVRVAGALVWPIPREGYEDLAPAAVAMLDAVTLAERRGNREESAMALNSLSVHCALEGAPEVSALLLEKAARDERDAGRPATEMFMLINLCGLYLPIDLQRAAEAVDRAAALGRLAPIQPRLDMIAALGAVVCWLSGDWPAAVDRARSVQGTIPYSAACAPAVAALVAAATGDPAAVKSGGAASDEDPGRHAYLVVAEEMPRQRPAVDRLSGAIQALLSADGLTEDFWLLWPVAVDAALDAGDVSAAEALVRLVETVQARELPPLGAAQYARLRGSVRLARGDGAQAAEPDLRRAVAALDAFGAPFYAARARLALAQALRGGGCPDQAREWETVAEQTLSDLGATPWHRRAGRSRRAGLREDAVGG
jgi:hypothetical protein